MDAYNTYAHEIGVCISMYVGYIYIYIYNTCISTNVCTETLIRTALDITAMLLWQTFS